MRYTVAVALAWSLLALLPVCPTQAADQTIKVTVNDTLQAFAPPAIVHGGKAHVPLRQVGAALGATVSYNGKTHVITMVSSCGKIIRLDQSEGLTISGNMYVPLRKIGEAFDCKVAYDGANQLVSITKPKTGG